MDWLFSWKADQEVGELGSLPLFFAYFICWACNLCIFQDKFILHEVVAGLVSKLANEFKSEPKNLKQRKPIIPPLIKGIPWGFFDGAS